MLARSEPYNESSQWFVRRRWGGGEKKQEEEEEEEEEEETWKGNNSPLLFEMPFQISISTTASAQAWGLPYPHCWFFMPQPFGRSFQMWETTLPLMDARWHGKHWTEPSWRWQNTTQDVQRCTETGLTEDLTQEWTTHYLVCSKFSYQCPGRDTECIVRTVFSRPTGHGLDQPKTKALCVTYTQRWPNAWEIQFVLLIFYLNCISCCLVFCDGPGLSYS